MKLNYLIALLITSMLTFSVQAENCMPYPSGVGHGPKCGRLLCPSIKKYNGDRVVAGSPDFCAHGHPLNSCPKCNALLAKIETAKKVMANEAAKKPAADEKVKAEKTKEARKTFKSRDKGPAAAKSASEPQPSKVPMKKK